MQKKPMNEITTERMLNYIKTFDYIKVKYGISTKTAPPDLFLRLRHRESLEQAGKLKKIPPSHIAHGVKTLYNSDAKTQNDSMVIFDCVYQNIINGFLAIPGLETLFDVHFYDFEWDMHTEYNFSENSHSYYRDHVEHQIRNMYMLFVLLDNFHFMDILKSMHSDPSLNKIANYVYIKLRSFSEKQYVSPQDRTLLEECAPYYFADKLPRIVRIVFEEARRQDIRLSFPQFLGKIKNTFIMENGISSPSVEHEIDGIFNDIRDGMMGKSFDLSEKENPDQLAEDIRKAFVDGLFCKTGYEVVGPTPKTRRKISRASKCALKHALGELYIYNYSFEYIIRSACIICALFHDISYPLCHFNTIRRRISAYIPSMNAFIHNTGADIDRVISILKPSLLLNVVSENEIRNMLSHEKKWDHGVYSAVALLLSFYESGRIHQLSADKQAAIEVAAVAIYNHNFKYGINSIGRKKADDSNYFRPLFFANPISYLHKICDELQEWDRKYFEFSTEKETVFCPKCFSPILHTAYYGTDDDDDKKYTFRDYAFCRCGKPYTIKKFFPVRELYTVTCCNWMKFDIAYPNYDRRDIICYLNYDALKLLHMADISSQYALYRQKELHNLKNLLRNQRYYSDNDLIKYDAIYLDYIMTCNPIYLKAFILKDYLFSAKKLNIEKYESEMKQKMKLLFDRLKKYFFVDFTQKALSIIDNIKDIDGLRYFFSSVFSVLDNSGKANRQPTSVEKNGVIQDLYNLLHGEAFEQTLKGVLTEEYGSSLQAQDTQAVKRSKNDFKAFFDAFLPKIRFYFDLAVAMEFRNHGIKLKSKRDYTNDMTTRPGLFDRSNKGFEETVVALVEDCCELIYTKPIFPGAAHNLNEEEYYSFCYENKHAVSTAVDRYCNPTNWYKNGEHDLYHLPYDTFSAKNLDYYSDLFLFELLGRKGGNI